MRRAPRHEAVEASQLLAACALLLEYPDDELRVAAAPIPDLLAGLAPAPPVVALLRFARWWSTCDVGELERQYVETFDLRQRCSLYLTYYSEGDKRGRGMALLRLRKLYRAAGLPMASDELPDHLAVMLEFAAHAPGGRGIAILREHRATLELLRLALVDQGSPYADVLAAVAGVLGEPTAGERVRAATLATNGPPRELVGLEPFAPPDVMPSAEARR
ncbi:Respiratory nitrate reductase delta chain [Patulibacter medicamentivorans]|uniref:Respiratory nitrate reductase delta chain n=1 Tax=Patulibacter medicamentivorans TaxID=1097667 RepID=H0E199_9ACTN|nr:nitrate reductase molybdenum cofactor assembly chaperone [Patulibacter medicamentivorans]EHN12538.1 Respiratory nitrate reductase delta chain [Patulibacter medicamentivorans]